ncbi:MAG: hypothetical protein A2Y17_11310 [Clostridiales bacterium GWF2_38_85]|nr:MAG: hypothetical protein A2Y17_11310 [Clostridiales bacterium GWF2_38_85]HBL84712.1 hypothetical protein [Clostridiales bacterium]
MNAKEYFKQISRTEAFISTKKQRMDALKALASGVGSPNLSGMPKNPSGSLSPMADAVCKALDLEAEIHKDEFLLQEKKVFLLELIGTIEICDCQIVLIKRYFEHLSWDDIASSMFYSTRWIYKLHGRALEEMDRKLKERNDSHVL